MDNPNTTQHSAENAAVDLTAFDADYATAKVRQNQPLPDGKYRVRIRCVELAQTLKGLPLLNWDLVVLAGPFTGRHLFKRTAITAASLPVIKSDLQILKITLAKLSALPNHLESLAGKTLSVTKRTKNGYENIYYNKSERSP